MEKNLRSEFNTRQYMLAEDFEVYYYSDPHFQSIGSHRHAYTEVYLFEEGNVQMEIAGEAYPLAPGHLIVVPPGTAHRVIIRNNDRPYRRFVFWISEAYCALLRKESADYLYLFDRAAKQKEYVYQLDLMEFNSLRSRLFQILEEQHTDRFARDTQIGIGVRDLLLYASRCIFGQSRPHAKKESAPGYRAIAEYVSDHLDEDLRLETLSRIFFLNKYYIAHLMKRNTGFSLHQYITKKRLAACCEAMRGGKTVGECCTLYGFQNYSGFYRAFLKEYGMTPTEYLKK